eukprot:sb/3472645/
MCEDLQRIPSPKHPSEFTFISTKITDSVYTDPPIYGVVCHVVCPYMVLSRGMEHYMDCSRVAVAGFVSVLWVWSGSMIHDLNLQERRGDGRRATFARAGKGLLRYQVAVAGFVSVLWVWSGSMIHDLNLQERRGDVSKPFLSGYSRIAKIRLCAYLIIHLSN